MPDSEPPEVQVERIKAETERNRLASREKIILAVVAAVSSIISPLATGLGAYWLARLDTKVQAVEDRQAENGRRLRDVQAHTRMAVGAPPPKE